MQYELAQVYRKGLGVGVDLEISLAWYRQAGEVGHAKAQTMLGFLYRNGIGVEADLKQAVQWYQRATEQGEPTALFNLGSLYRKGYGVPKNETKALDLYREAAGKGNAQAKQMLRKMRGWDCILEEFPDLIASFIREEPRHDSTTTYTPVGYYLKKVSS